MENRDETTPKTTIVRGRRQNPYRYRTFPKIIKYCIPNRHKLLYSLYYFRKLYYSLDGSRTMTSTCVQVFLIINTNSHCFCRIYLSTGEARVCKHDRTPTNRRKYLMQHPCHSGVVCTSGREMREWFVQDSQRLTITDGINIGLYLGAILVYVIIASIIVRDAITIHIVRTIFVRRFDFF